MATNATHFTLYSRKCWFGSFAEKFLIVNCIKKGSRKLSQNWGKFSSTALLVSNIWHKVLFTGAVLEFWPKFRDNFLK